MDHTPAAVSSRTAREQTFAMERYYRLQSKIYDATRWSFLFGRRRLVRALPFAATDAPRIVEVGCGTGFNTTLLARRYPLARITALDASSDMVRLARRRSAAFGDRVRVVHQPYGPGFEPGAVDLVLFSYSLTMINPQWGELLELARQHLRPGGYVAVVDFHDSPLPWFKRHMAGHHVRMDAHLLPVLRRLFRMRHEAVRPAYRGVWEYVEYIGQKEN